MGRWSQRREGRPDRVLVYAVGNHSPGNERVRPGYHGSGPGSSSSSECALSGTNVMVDCSSTTKQDLAPRPRARWSRSDCSCANRPRSRGWTACCARRRRGGGGGVTMLRDSPAECTVLAHLGAASACGRTDSVLHFAARRGSPGCIAALLSCWRLPGRGHGGQHRRRHHHARSLELRRFGRRGRATGSGSRGAVAVDLRRHLFEPVQHVAPQISDYTHDGPTSTEQQRRSTRSRVTADTVQHRATTEPAADEPAAAPDVLTRSAAAALTAFPLLLRLLFLLPVQARRLNKIFALRQLNFESRYESSASKLIVGSA